MPLNIAIDASRATGNRPTGTEYYARRLIQSLLEVNDAQSNPHQITLYFRDTPQPDLFPRSTNVKQVVLPWRRGWTHLRLAMELWKTRPDLTFVPAHTLPFLFPGKALVTVHDLGYKYFPEAHPFLQRCYLDLTTRHSQARATKILADSQATAADLRRFYGTAADKIKILYPGADQEPLRSRADHIAQVREKYRLPQRYFLFIGTLQPRKNIRRIVQAFAQCQQTTSDGNTAMVLAGGKGWLYDERWLQDVENIRTLGYIDESDKAGLLRGALALVYPSLHEGFGFPAIEAMICGTPVITSNLSSLPEIVGDAGLLVDPLDVDTIAVAMRRISDDANLRSTLIDRGHRRAAAFSWAQAAERLLQVLEEFQSEA